jgi:two-component system sensor histidine kinase/response regulator
MSSLPPPEAVEPDEPVLSEQALDRLRELDPTGQAKLLDRIFSTFESSTSRLMAQLEQAWEVGDLKNVGFVAHTLKSSSASIGALRLMRHCLKIESMVNQSTNDALPAELDALRVEMDRVLAAVRTRRSPTA